MGHGKLKIQKKSQTTVFIVIAIVIFSLVIALSINRTGFLSPEKEKINPEIEPIYSYVLNCIEQTGEDAVYQIGQTGGYVIVPEEKEYVFLDNESDAEIAYYLYNDQNLMPSKEEIEKELAIYMDNFLGFCIRDFIEFRDFEIDYKVSETKAVIEDKKVIFSVNYPLSIKKEDKSYEITNFKGVEIDARVGETYSAINEIMNKQMQSREDICISCLNDVAGKYELNIQMMESFNRSVIFVVRDPLSRVYGRDYGFYFANKYGGEE